MSAITALRFEACRAIIEATDGTAVAFTFDTQAVPTDTPFSVNIADGMLIVQGEPGIPRSSWPPVTMLHALDAPIERLELSGAANISFQWPDGFIASSAQMFASTLAVTLSGAAQLHNFPSLARSTVKLACAPGTHVCFERNCRLGTLDMSASTGGTINDVCARNFVPPPSGVAVDGIGSVVVPPRSSERPPSPPRSRRRTYAFDVPNFVPDEALAAEATSLLSMFGFVRDRLGESVSDADCPDPDARLLSILESWKERVATLRAVKGFLRRNDLRPSDHVEQQHPTLGPRLSSTEPVRVCADEAWEQYGSEAREELDVHSVPEESNPERCCVICYETRGEFAVCAACVSARVCESCLTRQVMLSNDKCCVCNNAPMRRPVRLLD